MEEPYRKPDENAFTIVATSKTKLTVENAVPRIDLVDRIDPIDGIGWFAGLDLADRIDQNSDAFKSLNKVN